MNSDLTPGDCLVGAVELTKNADLDKYRYSRYGIGFDARSDFSINGEFDKNIIFALDRIAPMHTDKRKIYILLLGKGPT